ncbi:hypothetical protein [Streptomyces cinereoruber]|uniref:hypothetical protein n=1 Tax=Streptomyces cinereoruber TaxID=67260 RepID=UPI003C3093A4
MVGEALGTVAATAARTLDDTRYLLPALTWQVAADQIADCVTTDHRAKHLRVLLLSAHALEAVWACRAALIRATGHNDDAERLADLLDGYLQPVHHTGLSGLIEAVDRVLAVLTLDLSIARTLAARVALNGEIGEGEEGRAAFDEVLAAPCGQSRCWIR